MRDKFLEIIETLGLDPEVNQATNKGDPGYSGANSGGDLFGPEEGTRHRRNLPRSLSSSAQAQY